MHIWAIIGLSVYFLIALFMFVGLLRESGRRPASADDTNTLEVMALSSLIIIGSLLWPLSASVVAVSLWRSGRHERHGSMSAH